MTEDKDPTVRPFFFTEDIERPSPIRTLIVQPLKDSECDYCERKEIFFLIPVYQKNKDKIVWYCNDCFRKFLMKIG